MTGRNHNNHQVKEQPLVNSLMNMFCRAAHQSSLDADLRDLLLHSSEETAQVKLCQIINSPLVDYCGA